MTPDLALMPAAVPAPVRCAVLEPHFTAQQLAEAWGFSAVTIRALFQDEPGVLRIGTPSRRLGRKLKRRYFSLRIPESVARRVHVRLTQVRGPARAA